MDDLVNYNVWNLYYISCTVVNAVFCVICSCVYNVYFISSNNYYTTYDQLAKHEVNYDKTIYDLDNFNQIDGTN